MPSGYMHFDDLENDSLRLLAFVSGMPEALRLLDESTNDSSKPTKVLADSIVESLLISLAVRFRMVEDKFLSRSLIVYPFERDAVCRFVKGSPTSADKKKSGIRLASDKLVHSEFIAPVGSGHEHQDWSRVICRGSLGKGTWTVLIDLTKLAISGICLAQQYEDNWEATGKNIIVLDADEDADDGIGDQ